MTIFLILAPFGSFALLMLVTSAEVSLFASAGICLAVIGIERAAADAVQHDRRQRGGLRPGAGKHARTGKRDHAAVR